MGILSRLFGRERRAGVRASDPYLAEFFGMRGIGAASADDVLSNLAVATACVSRRSQGLASVPLNIHRNIGPSNAARAENHPLYDLLNYRPNDYQSAYEFREFLVRSHDLHGNAFAEIERDARGRIVALHPIHSAHCVVERLESGRLRYRVSAPGRATRVLLQEEILHIRGPSRDGVIGMSPIRIAAGAMSLALGGVDTARAFVSNGVRPGGILTIDQVLKPEQRKAVKENIVEPLSGSTSAGGVFVLEAGMKFQPVTMTMEDAQFLETRKLSNEDVARIFDCPPTSVGINERATYSNVQEEALALVRNCLAPLAARFESALARCLLTEDGRRQYFIRHDFSELLRGDMKTRFEAYRLGRETGIYSVNDVRRLENEAPIAGGDQYHMPANWMALGATPASPEKAG